MMKKKIIVPIALVLIVGLSAFVIAETWVGEMQQRPFEDGWNLVYGLMNPDQLDGQLLQKSNIKAIYAFIPTTQEYLRAWPNPDQKAWENLDMVFDDHELLQTGFWVYSEQDVDSKYWLYDTPKSLNERPAYKGWNFVGITSDMVGKTLSELEGNCDIEKSYFFASTLQEWKPTDEAMRPPYQYIEDKMVSQVWVIKVSNNCQLGTSGGSIPSLPSLPQ
jgi:hypothetical protein